MHFVNKARSQTTTSRKRTALQMAIGLLTMFGVGPVQAFQLGAKPVKGLHRLSYSMAADLPNDVQPLQGILKQQPKSKTIPNILEASTAEHAMEIASNSLGKLTIFRFHAPYCRACKRNRPKFEKLARDHPDLTFVNVAVNDKNKKFVIRELGVNSIPFGGVFHPEIGMVEAMSINNKHFVNFQKIVQEYKAGQCDLLDENQATEQRIDFSANPYHIA